MVLLETPDPSATAPHLPLEASKWRRTRSCIVSSMALESRPVFGFRQPTIGFAAALRCNAMKGQTKKHKVPGEMREVLAQNVNRLMEERYKTSPNRPMSLANDAGVSLSSVQRILSRETGASIDTVEAVAKVLGLPTFQMLVPWGLLGRLAAAPHEAHGGRQGESRGREYRRPERVQAPSRTPRRTAR